jgi:signal transduction histidine kinase
LCRSIAQDHGGRISLESIAGQGTRITLWLPFDTNGAATLGQ